VWRDAITAVVAIVVTDPPMGLDELVEVVRLLVRLEADPSLPNATADRDHPARQRLAYLISELTAQFGRRSAEVRQLLTTVADELTAVEFLDFRLELLVLSSIDPLALRDLVADDPLAAATAASLLAARLAATQPSWAPDDLLPVAESLTHSPDPASGLLAHTLITAAAPRTNWSSTWQTHLQTLRTHPHPHIRRLSLNVTTAVE
jgi:hypothetical protein